MNWLDSNFRDVVPDKELQIMFAPPDRPFAEVSSGRVTGGKTLRLPRVSVSRADYEYDPDRRNQTLLRYCGPTTAAGNALNQANFPIPVNLPYQVDFWTEYESEMQAYFSHFLRQLYSGIIHITVYINNLWTDKITPYIMEPGVANAVETDPGGEFREIRTTFQLRCEAFLYDEVPTTAPTIREVKVNTYDFETEAAWDTTRVRTPVLIGTGDAIETTFTHDLNTAVVDPSVLAYAVVGGLEVRGYDQATGIITGTGVTGTITYATGEISVTFTTAPDDGEGVYIEFEEDS